MRLVGASVFRFFKQTLFSEQFNLFNELPHYGRCSFSTAQNTLRLKAHPLSIVPFAYHYFHQREALPHSKNPYIYLLGPQHNSMHIQGHSVVFGTEKVQPGKNLVFIRRYKEEGMLWQNVFAPSVVVGKGSPWCESKQPVFFHGYLQGIAGFPLLVTRLPTISRSYLGSPYTRVMRRIVGSTATHIARMRVCPL